MFEDRLKAKLEQEKAEKERQENEGKSKEERLKKHKSDFNGIAKPIIEEAVSEFLKVAKKYNARKTRIEICTSGLSRLFGHTTTEKEAWALPRDYIDENGTFYIFYLSNGRPIYTKASPNQALDNLCDYFYRHYTAYGNGAEYEIPLIEAAIKRDIEQEFLNCMHIS